MLLLPLARPIQRLDEHHGIVMDWARCGLAQRYFKKPYKPSFATYPAYERGKDSGNKYCPSLIWS
jgi:hypothetical protein